MIEVEETSPSKSKQCELLGIHRSGLYYKPLPETDENIEILAKLDKQYQETPFYGSKRLLATLLGLGYHINIKRVRRLMKLMDWRTIYPLPHTTKADPDKYKYPYLLKGLNIEKANQVWSIDITYIPMERGFMYLFAIIDVYSRYVVGWGISNSMTAEWCCSVLEGAIAKHGSPEIINSDQGSQFTSDQYVKLLNDNNIKISMDSKGRAIDNIFIERLWRSVKYENIYLHAYQDGKQLYSGLETYFYFYNTQRPHQSLNNKTPVLWYNEGRVKAAA